jgi:hypothetical protein
MENVAAPGDWIVFPLSNSNKAPSHLGGPWMCARVFGVNRSSYSVEKGLDLTTGATKRWVYKENVKRVFLSRGEAEMCVAALTLIEKNYIEEKNNLAPRFRRYIDVALGINPEGE